MSADKKGKLTFNDLKGEVLTAIKQHPEVKHTNRLNIHYARMGEGKRGIYKT